MGKLLLAKILLLSFIIWTPMGLNGSQMAKSSVPQDWQKTDIDGKYKIYLPPDMKPGRLFRDSGGYRRVFSNARMRIVFGYVENDRSCSFTEHSEISDVKISGKKAEMGVDYYFQPRALFIQLCFPDIGDGRTKAWMIARCTDQGAFETAEMIFNSVEF